MNCLFDRVDEVCSRGIYDLSPWSGEIERIDVKCMIVDKNYSASGNLGNLAKNLEKSFVKF